MAELAPSASADDSTQKQAITVGTRRSILARIQTDIVVNKLKELFPKNEYKIHAMDPLGDRDKVTALPAFNAKSLWTHELEELLLSGELDLIVHSLKDMPTQLPPTLQLGAVMPREDPRDALVMKASLVDTHKSLASLPEGAVIGTSALRRSAQLKRLYPHLRFTDVRGNIGTRLAKLDDAEGPYSALILAAAGLIRLGMEGRITSYLSKNDGGMLHAVGQGAIGIETRQDDERTRKLLAQVGCPRTTKACLAERSLMRTLEGGCSVPIGVETEWQRKSSTTTGITPALDYHQSGKPVEANDEDQLSDNLVLQAIVVSLDGQDLVDAELTKRVTTNDEAEQLGKDVAAILVERGAAKILDKINSNRTNSEKKPNSS